MASASLRSRPDHFAVDKVPVNAESCDVSELSQTPLDVRVAEFLAGLDDCSSSDTVSLKKASFDTASGVRVGYPANTLSGARLISEPSGAWGWEYRKGEQNFAGFRCDTALSPNFAASKEALHANESNQAGSPSWCQRSDIADYTDRTSCAAATPATARGTVSQKLPRRRRYRNQQQKLSNSLAQKRYRERKKQAFEHMQSVVDQLLLEVESLQGVRAENERLLQLVGGSPSGRYHENASPLLTGQQYAVPPTDGALPNGYQPTGALPRSLSDNGGLQLSTRINQAHLRGGRLLDRSGYFDAKASAPLPESNAVSSTVDLARSTAEHTIALLENEWNRSLLSLEQVVNRGVFGRGAAPQNQQELLGAIVNRLNIISSRTMNAKIQQAVEENKSNNRKINELIRVLSGCQSG